MARIMGTAAVVAAGAVAAGVLAIVAAGVLAIGPALRGQTAAQAAQTPPAAQTPRTAQTSRTTQTPQAARIPQANYYVYVGAESADLLHRVRFGPGGATLDRTLVVGELATETEGPHGLRFSPDGRFLYMTTGHGVPGGKLWKFHAGPDTLVGGPVSLGHFPATLDLTPGGLYAFVVNFNLHGERTPSSVSVVYAPEMVEVERIETCVMPHGARLDSSGDFLYSACMMDDQVVEVDTRTFTVARRFAVEPGCSPTWATPVPGRGTVLVACNRRARILEIDRESWSLARTIETGDGPYNLDVVPAANLLVATLKQGAAVQFFDLESGRSLAVVPSSTTVTHGVATSPDGRYAFVSVEGVGAEPGKVDVFDLSTYERVADVAVGQQAGGIAFWKIEGSVSGSGPRSGRRPR